MKKPRRLFRRRPGAGATPDPPAPDPDEAAAECARRGLLILRSMGYGWHVGRSGRSPEGVLEDARAACIVAGTLFARFAGAGDAEGAELGFELARAAMDAMNRHWSERIAGTPRLADPGRVAPGGGNPAPDRAK